VSAREAVSELRRARRPCEYRPGGPELLERLERVVEFDDPTLADVCPDELVSHDWVVRGKGGVDLVSTSMEVERLDRVLNQVLEATRIGRGRGLLALRELAVALECRLEEPRVEDEISQMALFLLVGHADLFDERLSVEFDQREELEELDHPDELEGGKVWLGGVSEDEIEP